MKNKQKPTPTPQKVTHTPEKQKKKKQKENHVKNLDVIIWCVLTLFIFYSILCVLEQDQPDSKIYENTV